MTLTVNKKTYEAGELVAYVAKLEKENAKLKEAKVIIEDLLNNSNEYARQRAFEFIKED